MSTLPPQTEEEHTDLCVEVYHALMEMPEAWTTVDHDAHTSIRERAIWLLHAAGLIDQRCRFRLSDGEKCIDVLFGWNGEILDDVHRQRLEADLARLGTIETCMPVKPVEWRLSDHGRLARRDIEEEDVDRDRKAYVFEYILRSGRHVGRPPAAGDVVSYRLEDVGTQASPVEIANWIAGAEALRVRSLRRVSP